MTQVLEDRDSGGNVVCEVRCECGKSSTVKAHRLVNGVSTQCRSCAQRDRRETEGNVIDFPTKNTAKRGLSKWDVEARHSREVRETSWLLGCSVTAFVHARDEAERERVQVRIDGLREKLRGLGEDDQAAVTRTLEKIEAEAERRRMRATMRR